MKMNQKKLLALIALIVILVVLAAVLGITNARRANDAQQEAAAAATQTPAPIEATATDTPQEEYEGPVYEGALAGKTEEEIAAMALAEENHESQSGEISGAEDGVD